MSVWVADNDDEDDVNDADDDDDVGGERRLAVSENYCQLFQV